MNLQSYLDEMGARYHLSRHDTAYTAQDLAHAEHVSGRRVIKPVVVEADGRFVLCALPACHKIDLNELRDQLDASHVRLAEEQKLRELFPDCELGAEPPIGRLFGMPTIMDESMLQDDRVVFQAGRHDSAVTMTMAEYRRLAQPEIAHFGRQMM
jgi:Ala-tRNA(Pro) deacylase